MKQETQPLSATQSLDLITEMINQAKGNVQRDSFYFLLWGWVVATANIGHFLILQFTDYPRPYIVWLIAIPAYIISLIHGRRGRAESVRTHLDKIHSTMWMAFGICIPVIILFGNQINFQIDPMIMLLASLPTYLSGVILRFQPLKYGGILLWAAAILGLMLPVQYQYPLMAFAIVLGYLVPGYMLRRVQ